MIRCPYVNCSKYYFIVPEMFYYKQNISEYSFWLPIFCIFLTSGSSCIKICSICRLKGLFYSIFRSHWYFHIYLTLCLKAMPFGPYRPVFSVTLLALILVKYSKLCLELGNILTFQQTLKLLGVLATSVISSSLEGDVGKAAVRSCWQGNSEGAHLFHQHHRTRSWWASPPSPQSFLWLPSLSEDSFDIYYFLLDEMWCGRRKGSQGNFNPGRALSTLWGKSHAAHMPLGTTLSEVLFLLKNTICGENRTETRPA